jgi:two-component system sensor histidine kinase KdpD
LLSEVSIVERLIAESSGITVVVLDTRTIREDRVSTTATPPTEAARKESQEKSGVFPENESPLASAPVVMWNEPMEKDAAIKQLLDASCKTAPEIRETAWPALLEREKQGGTFVGEDLAMPHARVNGLFLPLVALGVGKSGIYDREAGRSVRIMILMLSPADEPAGHVAMLGKISRMARDDQWRRDVLAAASPSDIVKIIRSWDGTS